MAASATLCAFPSPFHVTITGLKIVAASMCPLAHPFATDNGRTCCKFFNRINDTNLDPKCDGGYLQFDDPVSCCFGQEACVDAHYGCEDNPLTDGELAVQNMPRTSEHIMHVEKNQMSRARTSELNTF